MRKHTGTIQESANDDKGTVMNGVMFLHGLDSSGNGTKGQFFAKNFPDLVRPDFSGSFSERMAALKKLSSGYDSLIFVGSSYGGLMATCYALNMPNRITRLILLAPALNFEAYETPSVPIEVETLIVIGQNDTVTPPHLVIPKARKTFLTPQILEVDDDHFLHKTFEKLDWPALLKFR